MLEKIRIRLAALGTLENRDDTSQDEVLELMISDAVDAVLAYCHRKDLPKGLEYVVRDLVVRTVQSESEGAGDVASIKRGDTQINYTQTVTKDSFTDLEKHALDGYRRVRIG